MALGCGDSSGPTYVTPPTPGGPELADAAPAEAASADAPTLHDGGPAPESDSGSPASDARVDVQGVPEAGADVQSVPDAGADACGPVEICANGIDDNCNGLTDCDDPACPSDQCLVVPSGWQPVAFETKPLANALDPCPANATTSIDLYGQDVSGASYTCSCGCGTVQAASCTGTATVRYAAGDSTCGSNIVIDQIPVADNACWGPYGGFVVPNNTYWYAEADPIQHNAAVCSSSVGSSPPPLTGTTARACNIAADRGACAGGECAAKPGGAYKACVMHTGSVAGPSGYSCQSMFTSYNDYRTCPDATLCGCQDTLGCSNVQGVTYYEGTNCTGGSPSTGVPFWFGNQCQSSGANGGSMHSAMPSITESGSSQCSGVPSLASVGGVSLGGSQYTICCP